MPTVSELVEMFRKKGPEELQSMIANPADWSDEALIAAKEVLASRGESIPEPPSDGAQISTPRFAGFLDRFFASVIDALILNGSIAVIAVYVLHISPENILGFGTLMGLIVGWLYYAMMESSAKMGTVGKLALSLKVTDLQGNRVGFGRASGRFFGRFLSSFLFIGFIMAFFTSKKQALHDLLSGSLVYNR